MTWFEIEEQMQLGAELVFTNEIPGGWCFAIHVPSGVMSGRKVLMPVQRLPEWAGEPRPDDRRSVMAALEQLLANPRSLN